MVRERDDRPDEERHRSIKLLTLKDFLLTYHVGRTRAFSLIKNGELRFRHCGRRLVILEEDADNWARKLPLATAKPKKSA